MGGGDQNFPIATRMRNPPGARVMAEMGGTRTERGEYNSAFDTDLGDLLAFEHLGHHVPQFLQVI